MSSPPSPATGKAAFAALPASVDLPAVEREVLARWADRDVFRRSLERTAGGEPWIFYEGPPTANGQPGTHHVEARAFKDLFPRFKTMRGYSVPRRAGWDCHGLPVELAVEKELGFTSKGDIEQYGIAEFNAACKESALRNVSAFAAMTERMGYWVDLDEAYLTMAPRYVESVWWSLKTIFDKGLLVEDHRVTPYCPRDETPLSDHEVALGYEDDVDPSVYVRFPLTDGPWAGADLLVWTTTPWTLPSNTAVAVARDIPYVRATVGEGDDLVVAEDLLAVLGEDARVTDRLAGSDLLGSHYRRPLDLIVRRALRRRAPRRPRRPRHHRRRHRPGAHGARVRRRGPPRGQGRGPRDGQPDRPGRALLRRRPAGRRDVLQGRGPDAGRRAPRARRAVALRVLRALLSALLALPHAADLLRAALVVHPHHRDPRPPGRGERADELVPAAHQARPLRRVAREQRRLGALAQPVLGHPAADLAQRLRPLGDGLRRLARRARLLGGDRPHRARPAPPVRRRHHVPGAVGQRHDATGHRRHRRLVRLGRDAVRPVGRAAPPRGRLRAGLPGAVHLRGHRPDPRLVLLADGRGHAGVRPVVLRERRLPGPAARRAGPQDVEAPRQRARPVRAVRLPRRRRRALADAGAGLAVGRPPRRARGAARDRPQGPADLLEHRVVPGHLRERVGLAAHR